jgi:hypothetical protein
VAILGSALEGLSAGGLVVVAPLLYGVFWFAVIGISVRLRRWLHKEPISPVAWYD